MVGPDVTSEGSNNGGKHEQAPDVAPAEHSAGAMSDPEVDGLTIEDYTNKFGLSESEVWQRLRRGELVGRTQHGRLVIYLPPDGAAGLGFLAQLETLAGGQAASPSGSDVEDDADLAFLPPLPDQEVSAPGRFGASGPALAGGFLTLSGERAAAPELALLLDHLSLAKEENREILRMTQESIRRVSALSDQVIAMKDTVIAAKETEIRALREQLETRDGALRRLRQQNEDLEMLARTMADAPKA